MKKVYCSVFLLLVIASLTSAQGVSYVNLNDDATFSRNINEQKAVGVTPGNAGVTPSGGATYTIPIAVPPGTNGLAPGVSLNYSSQSGNGIAGYGWTIAGLSSIERTTKNHYHDNEASPITFTNASPFILDGQRLLLLNGAEYRTEVESFQKITKTGWGSFLVQSREGLTKDYGHANDGSRVNSSTGDTTIQWKLSSVTDKFGNYITYKYENISFGQSLHQNCLTEIAYTGNPTTGLQPYNKIMFQYKVRDDKNTIYLNGDSLHEALLLDKITVQGEDNALYKIYQLNYAWDGLYSVLNSIVETGSDGTQLNSTIFKNGSYASEVSKTGTTVLMGGTVDVFPGDYNGDGLTDLLVSTYQTTNGIRYNSDFKIYKRVSGNNNLFVQGVAGSLNNNFTIVNKTKMPNLFGIVPIDCDGNGVNEFVTIKREFNGENSYSIYGGITIYNPINDASSIVKSELLPPAGWNKMMPNKNCFYTGDIDGDSRTDLITFLSDGTGYRVFVTSPALGQNYIRLRLTDSPNTAYDAPTDADKIYVIDFDGDGKSELMIIKNDITKIYSIQKVGNEYLANKVAEQGYPTKWHDIRFGDFNGDAKTDILTKSTSGLWSVGYSTGRKFVEKLFEFEEPVLMDYYFDELAPEYSQDDKLVLADFNGDGKTDILHGWQIEGYDATYQLAYDTDSIAADVYYSNGTQFALTRAKYFSPALGAYWYAGDFNGDGKMDVLDQSSTPDYADVIMFRPNGAERFLAKIMNGFNEKTEFEYKPLSPDASFYLRNYNSTFPLNVVGSGTFMVSKTKADDGIGATNVTEYQYENALFHRTARGYIGFLKTVQKNLAIGTTTVDEYDISTTFYSTALRKSTIWVGTQRISQNFNENEFKSLGGKRFYVKVPFAKERNLLGGSQKWIFNTFDDDNGTITATTTIGGGETHNIITTYTNIGVPFKTKPQTITTTISRTGASVFSNTDAYEYYSTGAVKSKIEAVGKDCSTITQYGYNNLGNLVNQFSTAAAGNLPPIDVYSYTYEDKGRFVASKTNSLGQAEYYTHHPLHGKVTTYSGIDNQLTQYNYDGFGRRIWTYFLSKNYMTTTSYKWDIQSGDLPSVYWVLDVYPGKPDVKVWYDKLGRETKKQAKGFGGGWLTQTTQYDNRGNVYKKSRPYLSEAPMLTVYGYDAYNRLASTIDFSGTTTYSYTYSSGNLTTTVNSPTKSTSTTTDPTGKVISSTDPNGTVTFTYDGLGNVLTSKVGSTVMVQNQYDDCGRQKQMIDKSSGTTKYNYNAYGWLTKQTNANSQTEEIHYDNIGRVQSKTRPEGAITYQYYGTGENGVNQISEIVNSANGYTENYEYDAFSRLTKVREDIGGTIMSKQYSYNHNYDNNPATETYNDGFVLTNEYDANGYLQRIKNGSTTIIYEAQSVNDLGQCTSYALGNGLTSTTTYENGIPTRFYTAGVQDLQMMVNMANGSVNYLSDMLKNRFESFEYDNNDRLTAVHTMDLMPNLIQSLTMTYDANGNIKFKSDAGNYVYHSNAIRPNAVKRITNPNGVVPNQQQDIVYSSFGQPITITENGKQMTFEYGTDGQRRKSELKNVGGGVYQTRYYFGDYERQIINGTTQDIHYVNSPNGLVCMAVKENGGVFNLHYIYTNHLGSILTVTDGTGTVEAEQNFDAWGRRRNPTDWTYSNIPTVPNWLYRGYTGHEHLPEFNLINMNGRLYDPLLARMLSPDNFIQSPYNSQSYNRYSYVWNNPVKYNDPSGEFIPLVAVGVAAVIGAATNLVVQAYKGNIHSAGDAAKAMLIGGVAGAGSAIAAAYLAPAIAIGGILGGIMVTAPPAALGGFITGAGNAWALEGAGFGEGLSAGAVGAATGMIIGGVIGGITGGISAAIQGRNILDGSLRSLPKTHVENVPPQQVEEIKLSPYEKGQEGLRLNGIKQNYERIESLTGTAKYRVPDEMIIYNSKVVQIGEVKHYTIGRTVEYTNQLKDFIQYSSEYQIPFQLYVPKGVNISTPLQNAINQSPYTLPVIFY